MFPTMYIPVFIFYRGISEIAGPVAISLIRSILTLGKAIAAKYIFYATGAVLTVPNIQLIAENTQFVREYSIKSEAPAIALILMFITSIFTICNPVTQIRLLTFNCSINNQRAIWTPEQI